MTAPEHTRQHGTQLMMRSEPRADPRAPTRTGDGGRPDDGEEEAAAPPRPLPWWCRVAAAAGRAAATASRRARLGDGAIIGGRVALTLAPSALARMAAGRRVVLVSGTNGKTTTAHLLAAALGTAAPVAHNETGANMPDGVLAALMDRPSAPLAVLEVDELHLADVATQVDPEVIVLLNLSRDQLDRGSEVRRVASSIAAAIAAHPRATVVANADDPMVVWAVDAAARCVSGVRKWAVDRRCRQLPPLRSHPAPRRCRRRRLGLPVRSAPAGRRSWAPSGTDAANGDRTIPLELRLPGAYNRTNAVTAVAAATLLDIDPHDAATAMAQVVEVAGRYAVLPHRGRAARLLLAKNPAGWSETLELLDADRPLLFVVNAREADGRDTSWLWDVPFENLAPRRVVVAGERAADLGVRLTYAGIDHRTVVDPVAGLTLLPTGEVDVVANYSAFHHLRRRIAP